MRGGSQTKRLSNTTEHASQGIETTAKINQKSNKINWLRTIINVKDKPTKKSDLVYKSVHSQVLINHVVIWDTSASTLRHRAAAKAKGVILKLFEQAYLNRQRMGLLEFSADQVKVITPCQRVNRELIVPKVSSLAIGGNTPIDRALVEAEKMLRHARINTPNALSKLTLVTDGYFKSLPEKPGINAELTIIDINQANIKIGMCEALANHWEAELFCLSEFI